MAALEKAKESRIKRAQFLEKLETGKVSIEQVLNEACDDAVLGRIKVVQLVKRFPGYGDAKTAKIMEACKITDSRRLQGLGRAQKERLIEAMSAK